VFNCSNEGLLKEYMAFGACIAADTIGRQIAVTREILSMILHFLFMWITIYIRTSVRMISPLYASMWTIFTDYCIFLWVKVFYSAYLNVISSKWQIAIAL